MQVRNRVAQGAKYLDNTARTCFCHFLLVILVQICLLKDFLHRQQCPHCLHSFQRLRRHYSPPQVKQMVLQGGGTKSPGDDEVPVTFML